MSISIKDKEQEALADPLLDMSEGDWWQYKAGVCKDLYQAGLAFPEFSDDRANYWFKSLTFFVDDFIQPELPRPKFHDDWYWWSVREKEYINLGPRQHAKTTVHSVHRVVWEICMNRNITFLIILATTKVAKSVLTEIKGQLTQNPRIRAGFGVFDPNELDPQERTVDLDWSQDTITVQRDDFSIKDPTVAVVGALTNVLSRRAHRLIVDDLLTKKIARSAAESEALDDWYGDDVQPVLHAGAGQEMIIGTPYGKGDFYDNIVRDKGQDNGGPYKVHKGDAVVDEVKKLTLWPDKWPWEALLHERARLGSIRFNRNFRCRIVSDSDSPFPMIWFEGGLNKEGIFYRGCYDDSLTLGIGPNTLDEGRWLRTTVLAVDPAIGETKSSKFFAMVVLGLDFQANIVLLDIVRGVFNFVAQKRLLIQKHKFWNPRYTIVESNAYQKALKQGINEDAPEIVIIPFYSQGKGKYIPGVGVPAMDIFFETGRVRIPRGDAISEELTDILVEELHYWGRHSTSDVAMAFWFAFEKLRPELERLRAMPKLEDLIRGDREVYERHLMTGITGARLPRKTLQRIRQTAMAAPLAHLSPVNENWRRRRRSRRILRAGS